MNSISSPVSKLASCSCFLAVLAVGSSPLVSQAALILNVGDHDVSASSPTIVLSLQNTDTSPLVIRGADVLFTIQSGGPTVDISGTPSLGLDMQTGTIFNAYAQTPYSSPFGPLTQAWGLYTLNPNPANFVSLAAETSVTLGTLTFDSFPLSGSYTLSFSGTTFMDQDNNAITPFTINNGLLTVVPEPVHIALGISGGLFALSQLARFRRDRTTVKAAADD